MNKRQLTLEYEVFANTVLVSVDSENKSHERVKAQQIPQL